MYIRRRKIRALTTELLQKAGVFTPPVPVDDIAFAQGVKLHRDADAATNISGFLFLGGDKPIIGVNSALAEARQRFTIAHELGHLLLHSNAAQEVYVDNALFRVYLRDGSSSTGEDEKEREANLFAAELLMPADFLAISLGGQTQFNMEEDTFWPRLIKEYEVSREAMMIRLSSLGYIEL